MNISGSLFGNPYLKTVALQGIDCKVLRVNGIQCHSVLDADHLSISPTPNPSPSRKNQHDREGLFYNPLLVLNSFPYQKVQMLKLNYAKASSSIRLAKHQGCVRNGKERIMSQQNYSIDNNFAPLCSSGSH